MDNVCLSLLFYRYISNNCSKSERQELLRLLADPENEEQVKVLMEELWNGVPCRKLSADQSERIFNTLIIKRQRPYLPWLKMAAVFVIVVLSALGTLYFRGNHSRPPVAQQINQEAKTNFITLPDESTVILNAGSTLDYAESFRGNVREVFLKGEGFFDIKHDSARAFVVHTGKLRTTVLGTAFNIRAYPDQEIITVTVKRGKVKVSDDKRVFGILNPNQQISLDRKHQYAEQKPVDSHRVTEWIEKDILFDDVTMAEAIIQLGKRFDVSITLDGKDISKCRFTATFAQGEDLKQILEILCEFNNATLTANEAGGFVISGGACR